MKAYVNNLKLWFFGIVWLWTRKAFIAPGFKGELPNDLIFYKLGWGPLRFLPLYLTTYLAGTLCGYGCVSLSRAWADRQASHPFARFLTRLLNWIFPGSRHGVMAGPRLWGSVNLRDN